MPEHYTLRSLHSLDHYVHLLRGSRREKGAVIDQRELGMLSLKLYEDYRMDSVLFAQAVANMGWVFHRYGGRPQIQGSGFIYWVRDGDDDLVHALCSWQASLSQLRKHHSRLHVALLETQFKLRLWMKTLRYRRSRK